MGSLHSLSVRIASSFVLFFSTMGAFMPGRDCQVRLIQVVRIEQIHCAALWATEKETLFLNQDTS